MATTKTLLAAVLTLSTLVVGCEQQGETVGARGGVISSDDGRVTLDVPAGALTHDVELSIELVDESRDGVVGAVYAIEPAGVQFMFPATLTYDLAADVGDETRAFDRTDVSMDDLVLVTEKADRWAPMADREVDEDAQVLSASVIFTSTYAIVTR